MHCQCCGIIYLRLFYKCGHITVPFKTIMIDKSEIMNKLPNSSISKSSQMSKGCSDVLLKDGTIC